MVKLTTRTSYYIHPVHEGPPHLARLGSEKGLASVPGVLRSPMSGESKSRIQGLGISCHCGKEFEESEDTQKP